MKNSLSLLVLLCCFSITTYSLNLNATSTSFKTSATDDLRPKYRIGFNAPQIDHRQILLTIDKNTTDGIDWGYDAELYQLLNDDMYWVIDNNKYVIQATDNIFIGKEIPLGISTVEGGTIIIGIDAIENPIEGIKMFLKDKELNIIYDIQETDYQITLIAGEYLDRFVITFLSSETILNEDNIIVELEITDGDDSGSDTVISPVIENNNATINDQFLMYVSNGSNILNIKNKRLIKINNLVLYNRLGQVVQTWKLNLNIERVSLSLNVKEGIYIIQATTETGNISKRIVIRNI
ncbi:MAG: hypothetical protein COC22_05405 [Flavobacteriaceae bacterium]|nr:MAG: hypothetical protein COC22_05405 [Flavobacteriaceae bacterium]